MTGKADIRLTAAYWRRRQAILAAVQIANTHRPATRMQRAIICAMDTLMICLVAWAVWLVVSNRPRGPVKADLTLDLGPEVTMQFVLVPAGTFTMGSPDGERGRESDEGLQHEVVISRPFYMGVYEVTQRQYLQVMESGAGLCPGWQNPADHVSWNEAFAFCNKLSVRTGRRVRLPTEAEWEYACRAGTTTAYNTGKELARGEANVSFPPGVLGKLSDWLFGAKATPRATIPVGSFSPNGFGLYDMHGNVLEWCADCYGEDYYAHSPRVDPTGPGTGSHVLRGGSASSAPESCRAAFRCPSRPSGDDLIGFRVVVEVALPIASRPAASPLRE